MDTLEEKYLKHTITNLCEESAKMVECGKEQQAFNILKAATTILYFERWNHSISDELYSELIELTATENAKTIVLV